MTRSAARSMKPATLTVLDGALFIRSRSRCLLKSIPCLILDIPKGGVTRDDLQRYFLSNTAFRIVATLFRLVTTLFQHCNSVLR